MKNLSNKDGVTPLVDMAPASPQRLRFFEKFLFGRLLSMAQSRPVTLQEDDKPVAVLLSVEEYEHLQKLDDVYWTLRAEAGEDKGDWLGPEASEKFLQEILNAPD